MQKSGAAAAPSQNGAPFFRTNIWGNGSSSSNGNSNGTSNGTSTSFSNSRSRADANPVEGRTDEKAPTPRRLSISTNRDRKGSLASRRPSLSLSSPRTGSKGSLRRRTSASNGAGDHQVVTDDAVPPALPDIAVALAAQVSRDSEVAAAAATTTSPPPTGEAPPAYKNKNMITVMTTPTAYQGPTSQPVSQSHETLVYQHIQDLANKRISTMDYLRRAHEGRVYWFNTLLFDKPELARMPYFDSRRLARRATNYLLLGLSLPMVIDLNSSSPLEFLRSLNTLLGEFDSFTQIHTETGTNASSLSRARLPSMFRRGPAAGKGRRTSAAGDMGYLDPGNSGSGSGGGGFGSGFGGGAGGNGSNSVVNQTPTSVISFGLGGEGNDLLPGEEYTHLLTPSLPFDPDFFETFVTLCDILIDVYQRLMSLLPSARDCTPPVAELFSKADARIRKIILQGVVKEFEESSRAGLKQEVNNVSKVVLGGLM